MKKTLNRGLAVLQQNANIRPTIKGVIWFDMISFHLI